MLHEWHLFLGQKRILKSHFLRLYGCTSVFNTALRTAPCLERVAGPLEVVVRPRAAQKIHQNPCLATLHESLWTSPPSICQYSPRNMNCSKGPLDRILSASAGLTGLLHLWLWGLEVVFCCWVDFALVTRLVGILWTQSYGYRIWNCSYGPLGHIIYASLRPFGEHLYLRVLDVLYISLEFIAWSLGHTKSSAAQLFLMRPVVLHSCLRGLKGI